MLTDIEKLDEVLILFYITIFSFKEFSEHLFVLKRTGSFPHHHRENNGREESK